MKVIKCSEYVLMKLLLQLACLRKDHLFYEIELSKEDLSSLHLLTAAFELLFIHWLLQAVR
jgi:hypothetical protein